MKKHWKTAVIVIVGLAAAIQLVPVTRDNPAVVADFEGPADVLQANAFVCALNERVSGNAQHMERVGGEK